MRKILFIIGLCFSTCMLHAQEFIAQVEVNADRIQNVDPKVFQNLQRSLTDFINNRKWTNDNYKPSEKIICSFLLTLTDKSGESTYKGTLNIQASRPVYEADYNTAIVNFVDRDVAFKYDETQTLQFDDNRITGSDALVSNLTALVAFYANLILGLDYDSFAPRGGEEYLKRALYIVNNAPEEGSAILGWKPTQGNRNRYWLIDQLLSPRFAAFRSYWYTYHRQGLDRMSQQPDDARAKIMNDLPVLDKINAENPSSYLLQFFFNAKSTEYLNMLRQAKPEERNTYVNLLSRLDVPNAGKYKGVK